MQEDSAASKKKAYLAELQKQVEAKEALLQGNRAAVLAQGRLVKAKIEREKQEIEVGQEVALQ